MQCLALQEVVKVLSSALFLVLSNSSSGFLKVFQSFLFRHWLLFSPVLVPDHFRGMLFLFGKPIDPDL